MFPPDRVIASLVSLGILGYLVQRWGIRLTIICQWSPSLTLATVASREPSHMTWPQTIDQRYRIQGDEPLGSGGMGEVHLYFDLKLSRPVAIKRLSANVLGREDAVERFLREARMLASISDINVVAVYDLVTLDSQLYLITEYVPGRTLAQEIRSAPGGRLTAEQACGIMAAVSSGLASAHRLGIVHRDIKPGNVLIRTDGTVKICDFGIGKLISDATGGSTGPQATVLSPELTAADHVTALTVTGGFIGTPGYASPEQIGGRLDLSESSDLFAVGTCLFEALAGSPAFPGHAGERRERTIKGDANWPALPKDLPTRVTVLLAAALAPKPEHRAVDGQPLTAATLARELASRQTVATRPVRGNRLPRPLTRFIGRQKDLRDLVTLLASPPEAGSPPAVITLHGAGGIGKTRLAIAAAEAACRAAEQAGGQPPAICFADLSLITPADGGNATAAHAAAEQALIAALAADGRSIAADLTDALLTRTADRPVLLVIDNCETAPAAVRTMLTAAMGELDASRLTVLTTSREAIGVPGEHLFAVRPLPLPPEVPLGDEAGDATRDPKSSLPSDPSPTVLREITGSEAVELFCARARLNDRSFDLTGGNAGLVAAICRRVDGIPLAIEWAAALIAVMDLRAILETLRDATQGPPPDLAVTMNAGQRTLETLVGSSLQKLPAPLLDLLHRLSVLTTHFSMDAARALAPDWPDLVADLSRLWARSLVMLDRSDSATRYLVPATVRGYCRRTAPARRLATARAHKINWCLALAERTAPLLARGDYDAADAVLRPEMPHLREAWTLLDPQHAKSMFTLARQSEPPDARARLAIALHRYFYMYGPRQLGIDWALVAAEARTPATAPDRLLAELYRAAGVIAHGAERWPEAERFARVALPIFRDLGDSLGVARLSNNLGTAIAAQGRFEEAAAAQSEALDRYRQLGDANGMASVLLNLSFHDLKAGHFAAAQEHAGQAVAHFTTTGDRHRLATALHNLGHALMALGRCGEATGPLADSIATRLGIGDEHGALQSMIFLASTRLRAPAPADLPAAAEHSTKLVGYAERRCNRLRIPLDSMLLAELKFSRETLQRLLPPERLSTLLEVWSEETPASQIVL